MVFDGKYYTPTYGDLVETYSYSGDKSYIIEYDDMPLGIKDVKTKQSTKYLRYNRPFTEDKAVTIMLPFDFRKNDIRRGEYDNISVGKFYEFAGIEEVPFNVWIAVMKEVGVEGSNETTETTMKANTPYLFMPGEKAKYVYFTKSRPSTTAAMAHIRGTNGISKAPTSLATGATARTLRKSERCMASQERPRRWTENSSWPATS